MTSVDSGRGTGRHRPQSSSKFTLDPKGGRGQPAVMESILYPR